MPWAAIIPAVAALGSAAIGAANSSADRDQAKQQMDQAIAAYRDIGVPPAEATQIVLQQYKSAGKLTPELEQAYSQGDSDLTKISTDSGLKQAQLAALQQLQGIGEQGGHTLQDDANLQNILNQTNIAARGRQGAIQADMASRGLGGSGLDLAAQLSNAQNAGNQAGVQGLDIAAQQKQNALNAIMQSGQLAGTMQGQQFDQKAKVAAAQDAINRFNTQNRQDVASRNVAAQNQASQYNLTNDQRIADQNTGLGNYQEQYNKGQVQQHYVNQLNQAAGMSGQYKGAADFNSASADRTSNLWGGVGQGIGQAGTAYANYQQNQDYLNRRYPKNDSYGGEEE